MCEYSALVAPLASESRRLSARLTLMTSTSLISLPKACAADSRQLSQKLARQTAAPNSAFWSRRSPKTWVTVTAKWVETLLSNVVETVMRSRLSLCVVAAVDHVTVLEDSVKVV